MNNFNQNNEVIANHEDDDLDRHLESQEEEKDEYFEYEIEGCKRDAYLEKYGKKVCNYCFEDMEKRT